MERQYEEARAKIVTLQAKLGAMTKLDPGRRQALADVDAWTAYARDLKKAIGEANRRQAFAGLGTPIHEALLQLIEDESLVDAIEERALAILDEREKAAAERRAFKKDGGAKAG